MVAKKHVPEVVAPSSSGIKVIIVGFGYAGVVAAVECFRKGHQVIVFEQTKQIPKGGDMIGVSSNAANVIAKWGNGKVHAELADVSSDIDMFDLYDWKGEHLITQTMLGFLRGTGYLGNRRAILQTMVDYAESLGIDIRRGKRITEYWETDTEAGIIADGEKFSADCVLACDGVHSKARSFILGETGAPHATGYATYRAWFDGKDVINDPETRWLVNDVKDKSVAFIGPDVHVIFGTGRRCTEVTWVMTHLDTYDVDESWSFPGKVEDALKIVEGWDPRVAAIIAKTPKDQLIDHKLLWRDPLPRWYSEKGRMILVGDAAHTFLPTSIQGAGQAIEDAATIPICLQLAGKDKIPLALKTAQTIRYERVAIAQRMGVETRNIWHKTDWSQFKNNKKYLELPQPNWIFNHDCQAYAYEEFEKGARSVLTGEPYVPHNVPEVGVNHRTNDFDGTRKLEVEVA